MEKGKSNNEKKGRFLALEVSLEGEGSKKKGMLTIQKGGVQVRHDEKWRHERSRSKTKGENFQGRKKDSGEKGVRSPSAAIGRIQHEDRNVRMHKLCISSEANSEEKRI